MTKEPRLPRLDRASWIHRREGVDYGPFDTSTILAQIQDGDVGQEDEIMDQATGTTWSVGDIPAFAAAARRRASKIRNEAINREADVSIDRLRKGHRQRPVLFICVGALLLGAGWQVRVLLGAGDARHGAMAISVPAIPGEDATFLALRSRRLDVGAVAVPPPHRRRVRHRRAPYSPRRKSHGQMVNSVQSFNFEDEEIDSGAATAPAGPRPLGPGELRPFLARLHEPAVRCLRVNAQDLPPGNYHVRMRLDADGTLHGAVLDPEPPDVGRIRACLELVARGHRLRRFAGLSRYIALPIRIEPR